MVALACASGTQQASEPARALGRGPVRLDFAWPASLEGEVFARTTKIRSDGRERPERSVETRHRIRSEPHARGLRIVAEDLQILRVDGQERAMAAPMSDPNMLFLAPTLVVGASGEVLEVEGLEALQRAIAERAAANPATAERAGQVAAITASQERITAHWNSAVASWAGVEVEPGAGFDVELEVAGVAQPARIEVSEPIPCSAEDAAPRCLRLRLESRSAGSDGLEAAHERVRALASQLGVENLPVEAIRAVEEVEIVDVVTEPERLIPHAVRVRRERRIEIDDGGRRRAVEAIDENEHLYRW